MAIDPFFAFPDNAEQPSSRPFMVTPHDVNELPIIPKGIFVGTGGNITLRGAGATADVLFKNVPNGATLPVRAQYIRATGTTATDLIALA